MRAIEHQELALDELRSRAGTVLVAVSLVTSFLGARVLADNGDIEPWYDWAFSNDPAIMMNAHRDDPQWPDSVYVYLVDSMGADREKNGQKLTVLYDAQRAGERLRVFGWELTGEGTGCLPRARRSRSQSRVGWGLSSA